MTVVSCRVMGHAADEAITRPSGAYRPFLSMSMYACHVNRLGGPRQHPINSWLLWHGYIHVERPSRSTSY